MSEPSDVRRRIAVSWSVLQARRDERAARFPLGNRAPAVHSLRAIVFKQHRVRSVRPSVRPRRCRDGVRKEEAGREEPEDAARARLAAGQQGMLRLQPARADLRQHDDRLVRLHLLLWYAVSTLRLRRELIPRTFPILTESSDLGYPVVSRRRSRGMISAHVRQGTREHRARRR